MFWLALGYPLLAHLAVLTHDRRLEWLALVWLLGIAMSGALIQRRPWAISVLLVGSALLYWLVIEGNGLYALYVPAAAIPAALFMLFTLSLRAGETPLVTRIARLMHDGPLPDDLVVYTRHVTQLWCGVCAAMFLSAVLLALFAPPKLWSLMTNVVHYVVLGAVFILEYGYRRWRYRHHEHTGLFQYLRRLARTKLKV
ncbi:MAG TPA: hypothetical protein VFS58_11475 [Steroidobacteraceae bacterium]|nr:hypothetical protein [Steroidobacteraceae bacterium]